MATSQQSVPLQCSTETPVPQGVAVQCSTETPVPQGTATPVRLQGKHVHVIYRRARNNNFKCISFAMQVIRFDLVQRIKTP